MKMRTAVACLFVALCTLGACASRHGARRVEPLGLHDERLPIDTRRVLADAEDEVAIAQARVDDAERRLAESQSYGRGLARRVEAMGAGTPTDALREMTRLFRELSSQREQLARLELRAARATLDMARARLVLARAEAAMRFDLAVIEIEPFRDAAEAREQDVADAERAVEVQRAAVDASAEAAWTAYAVHVKGGGMTEALWGMP